MSNTHEWSPWGLETPFLKLHHEVVPALAGLAYLDKNRVPKKLGASEILVAIAVLSKSRPFKTEITVSHGELVRYVGCNERTVRRAVKALVSLGLRRVVSGARTQTSSMYDVSGFLKTIKTAIEAANNGK